MPLIRIEPPHAGAINPFTGEPYILDQEYDLPEVEVLRLMEWARGNRVHIEPLDVDPGPSDTQLAPPAEAQPETPVPTEETT